MKGPDEPAVSERVLRKLRQMGQTLEEIERWESEPERERPPAVDVSSLLGSMLSRKSVSAENLADYL